MNQPPNPSAPAFPFACQGPTTGPEFYYGLTKREYFAAMAMQGFAASGACHTAEGAAKLAVADADALLAALEKEP